jgi:transcription termination factor NusB
LAKKYGSGDSGKFVNGVLGRIVKITEGKNT